MKINASEKGIRLLNKCPTIETNNYSGDADKVRQVLINLLGNAIKFTDKGTVTLGITKTKINDNLLELLFYVKDTGVGIPPHQLETIFESFEQVDSSRTRSYGGTGLGLSISKQLVELMDGHLWVESTEGKGSTFFFSLRFYKDTSTVKTGTSQNKEIKDLKKLRSLKILLVEDNEDNRKLILLYLKKTKHQIISAKNGKEALELLEATPDINLVLMDVEMPIMDGYEATRLIRKKEQKGNLKPLPVIALSAHALPEHVQMSQESGCNEHVSKPLRKQTLLDLLDKYSARP